MLVNLNCFPKRDFRIPGRKPTKQAESVKPGKYPRGENIVAPMTSATIPVAAPPIGPRSNPANIIGMFPKLILTELAAKIGK